MINAARVRIGELVETLSVLDALLGDAAVEQLPGMAVARVTVAVDEAAAELARLVEVLASVGRPR